MSTAGGANQSAPSTGGGLPEEWQRLHPLSTVVRAGRAIVGLLVVLALGSFQHGQGTSDEIRIGIVVLAVIAGVVSWLVTRWRVRAGVLEIQAGLIRRTSGRFPIGRIQAVDLVRPGLARVLGMTELRIRMAGGGDKSGRLAYLPEADAARLRDRLLALAHGMDEATPAPPEQPLWAVSTGRLVAATALSGPALLIGVIVVVLVVLAAVAPGAVGPTFASSVPFLIALVTALARRLNGQYHLTVAHAPDGIRVRAGLVETHAETIPRTRVQALRMVQPLTWRPFGWVRLEVDVAGKATGGGRDRSARKGSGVLLPVGDRAVAHWLLAQVLPGAPAPDRPPPERVRWKTPLRYRHLSWGASERLVSTSSGRLRLVTDWVPLDKVQSVRVVQGPWQRRFRLASIHLDTAGRNVRAVLRDRDRGEVDDLMNRLPGACRAARAGAGTAPSA